MAAGANTSAAGRTARADVALSRNHRQDKTQVELFEPDTTMDLDLDGILPELYVGSCPIRADDVNHLKQGLGIGAVLNLQTDEDFAFWGIDWPRLDELYRRSGIEVRRVPVRDFDAEDLRSKLAACVQALDGLLRGGHKVYVHCSAGVNRSPSTVIAYLCWVLGWELDRAVSHVKKSHECDPYLDVIRLATEDRAN